MRHFGFKSGLVILFLITLPSIAWPQGTTRLKPKVTGVTRISSEANLRQPRLGCLEWAYDRQKNESVCVKYASAEVTTGGGCGGSGACGGNNKPGSRWEYKQDEALVLLKREDFRATPNLTSSAENELSKERNFSKYNVERLSKLNAER